MMTELQTPVDFTIFLLSLLSKRSIRELFPEPGGPITIECASLLLILPLLAIASSMALINCCEVASVFFAPTSVIEQTYTLYITAKKTWADMSRTACFFFKGMENSMVWKGGGGGGGGVVSVQFRPCLSD